MAWCQTYTYESSLGIRSPEGRLRTDFRVQVGEGPHLLELGHRSSGRETLLWLEASRRLGIVCEGTVHGGDSRRRVAVLSRDILAQGLHLLAALVLLSTEVRALCGIVGCAARRLAVDGVLGILARRSRRLGRVR